MTREVSPCYSHLRRACKKKGLSKLAILAIVIAGAFLVISVMVVLLVLFVFRDCLLRRKPRSRSRLAMFAVE